MEGRRVCSECGTPEMIIKAGPVTEIGTTVMKQITVYGCCEKECSMFHVETRRTEKEITPFVE